MDCEIHLYFVGKNYTNFYIHITKAVVVLFSGSFVTERCFIVVHFELNMIKKCNSVTVTMHDYCLPTTP